MCCCSVLGSLGGSASQTPPTGLQHPPGEALGCLPGRPGWEWPAQGSLQSCWTAAGRSLPDNSTPTCLQGITWCSWPAAGGTSATQITGHCHNARLLSGAAGCSEPQSLCAAFCLQGITWCS